LATFASILAVLALALAGVGIYGVNGLSRAGAMFAGAMPALRACAWIGRRLYAMNELFRKLSFLLRPRQFDRGTGR
jgi:hypothetical protein